ncbi:hypothetical protein MSAN_02078200 [Mycena sanguinolenta]|uniref:Bacteriophage T5 Orf172 DNA-binding domain-containing protein n=1 Tax=Mycena sanguinolenta TaxID=230812 RepID=A0A8H7CM27_9AGAR|nr:hypothetical protein MSAN_02078200 [Mycena sanguinolenta]
MSGIGNRISSVLSFHHALTASPSATDYLGALYAYTVDDVLKTGRALDPPIRKKQWCRQCRGEWQNWLPFYWKVPHAKKFEKIIHVELKRRGAWLGCEQCWFCLTLHQEKYDLRQIGGVTGFIAIVEAWLAALGWPIIRVYM